MPSDIFYPRDECGALRYIDVIHCMVHQGRLFDISGFDIDLDSTETHYILIKTGEKQVHIDFVITGGGGIIDIEIGEDAVASGGSVLQIFNRNRNSSNVPYTTAFDNPTVSTVGNIFVNKRILGSATVLQQKIISEVRAGAERVWKPNTNYVMLARTVAGADNCMLTIDGVFYEED